MTRGSEKWEAAKFRSGFLAELRDLAESLEEKVTEWDTLIQEGRIPTGLYLECKEAKKGMLKVQDVIDQIGKFLREARLGVRDPGDDWQPPSKKKKPRK